MSGRILYKEDEAKENLALAIIGLVEYLDLNVAKLENFEEHQAVIKFKFDDQEKKYETFRGDINIDELIESSKSDIVGEITFFRIPKEPVEFDNLFEAMLNKLGVSFKH